MEITERIRRIRLSVMVVVAVTALLVSIASAVVLLVAKPAQANFPGENGKIAFTSDRTGNHEIYTANPDGTSVEQLTNTPNADDFTPAFSPDGTKIAFPRYPTNEPCCPPGDWGIFVINLADGTETQITSGGGRDWDPYWSPDGTKLVFVRTSSGGFVDNTSDLYVANADGSGTPQALTSGGSYEIQPSWSPDGQKIVYTDGKDTNGGNGNIYIINASGGGSVKLDAAADFGSVDQSPAWSPDGTKIAWSHQNEIFVTNADNTGDTQQLTSGPASEGVGDYSPDGTKIAYDCYLDGNSDLCVMNADGSGQTNITNAPGVEANIAWGPKPVPSDTTKPTITINSPAEGASYKLGESVTADYSCSDDTSSGSDLSCTGSVPNGSALDTSSVGPKTFTVTSTDKAGNTETKTVNYSVIYNFSGFFQPVDNAPTLNVVKSPAGKAAIQLRFSLGSNQGLNVFDTGYPVSKSTACPSQAPTDVVEQTVPAEPSNLKYDASANQYIYTWKTESAWKGACRELNLRLKDGTDHKALFQFTK